MSRHPLCKYDCIFPSFSSRKNRFTVVKGQQPSLAITGMKVAELQFRGRILLKQQYLFASKLIKKRNNIYYLQNTFRKTILFVTKLNR